MKIAIVDDDKQTHLNLHTYLYELLGDAADITDFSSGEQFLATWRQGEFDLMILDIFMGGINGMDVAREVRRTDAEVRIVFSTTSNEFASESYEVNACYYLHKPFGRERVKAMLDRLNMAEMERLRVVTLPDDTRVALRDILYADFSAHKVTLHCKDGNDVVTRSSFSEVEPLLCGYPYFFSPYKGVVVNFYEVTSHTEAAFTLSDGTVIPISRRKAKETFEAYSSFRFQLMREDGAR